MQSFNKNNLNHLTIVRAAAIEAWLNVVGICPAIREALVDENIQTTEEAFSIGLTALREFQKEG